MDIAGKGVVVAGGASGLGEATVRKFHELGAHLTIADINEEKGQALVSELGERAEFVKTDVTDSDQVQAAIDSAKASTEYGLGASICCAGVGWVEKVAGSKGPHQTLPFETVLKVNLIGTFNVLRLAAHAMLENEPNADGERGVCINTASVAAFEGQIGQLAYSASKGGIVGMTLPAARDLASKGIRVCTIAPGLFDTPLLAALPEQARTELAKTIPFPQRLGDPVEYGSLAAQIAENPMLNGETIRLDGAIRMQPK